MKEIKNDEGLFSGKSVLREKKGNPIILKIVSFLVGILIASGLVYLGIEYGDDLVGWSQSPTYAVYVYTIAPLLFGGLGLLSLYLFYLGFRKERIVRGKWDNVKSFKIFSLVTSCSVVMLMVILIAFFKADLIDWQDYYGHEALYDFLGALVIVIPLSPFALYHVYGIFRKKKTRRAVIFTGISMFLFIGSSIFLGAFEGLRHVPETRGPYLSWSDDPQTTMTVSWEAPGRVSRTLQWSEIENFSNYNETQAIEHDYRQFTRRFHYSVTITGLQPGKEYFYKIPGFHDDVESFKTAPNGTQPFMFFAYGDTRESTPINSEHVKLVREMVRQIKEQGASPSLIINSGDIAYDFDDYISWDIHFNTIKPLSTSAPYLVSSGNHEWTSSLSDQENPQTLIHDYPNSGVHQINETSYSIRYSNAYFIFLGYPHASGTNPEVRTWLESELSIANQTADWIFVCQHVPPFTGTANRNDNMAMQINTVPLFHEYGVDVVFLGHDHNLQRMNITCLNFSSTIQYIITGGGGAGLYDIEDETKIWSGETTSELKYSYVGRTEIAKVSNEFYSVNIDGKSATFVAWDFNGNVLDNFTIQK
ncbi:MAG: purple acid phosphatase family protein [Promethearchaeota archaeon]